MWFRNPFKKTPKDEGERPARVEPTVINANDQDNPIVCPQEPDEPTLVTPSEPMPSASDGLRSHEHEASASSLTPPSLQPSGSTRESATQGEGERLAYPEKNEPVLEESVPPKLGEASEPDTTTNVRGKLTPPVADPLVAPSSPKESFSRGEGSIPLRTVRADIRPIPVEEEEERPQTLEDAVPLEVSAKQFRMQEEAKHEKSMVTEATMVARQKMRHRMIGAAVLLLGCVFVAPFFLDDETAQERLPIDSSIPPKEAGPVALLEPVTPPPTPVAAEPVSTSANAVAEKSVDKKALSSKDKDVSATKPSAKSGTEDKASKDVAAKRAPAEDKPKANKASADPLGDMLAQVDQAPRAKAAKAEIDRMNTIPPRVPEAKNVKGFFIQLMATSSELKADEKINELNRKYRLPAYKERLDQTGGTIWRVRVGPFKTRGSAEKARDTLMNNAVMKNPAIQQAS